MSPVPQPRTNGSPSTVRLAGVVTAALFVLMPLQALAAPGATISTDKPDYMPGETVTLSGAGWDAYEDVHVHVEDVEAVAWSYDADVTADEFGAFSLQFAISPDYIPEYVARAEGFFSGVATHFFTDGNVGFSMATSDNAASTSATYSFAWEQHETSCTGSLKSNGVATYAGAQVNVGAGNRYLVLGAVTPPAGYTFSYWSFGATNTTPLASPFCHQDVGGPTPVFHAHFVASNLPPVVNITSLVDPVLTTEGASVGFDFTASDPEVAALTYTPSCGTGTLTASSSVSFTCLFPTEGATTASILVSDGSLTDSDSRSVTIANVLPTVTVTAASATSAEGSAATFDYVISDPGSDVATMTYTCDGGAPIALVLLSGSFQCTYADGPATGAASASATDDTGAVEGSDTVSVTDVLPTVTLLPGTTQNVDEGASIGFSYTISDPGADTFAITTTCGGGSSAGTFPAGGFGCSYLDGPASFTAQVTATDAGEGVVVSDSTLVNVANLAPVVALVSPVTSVSEGAVQGYTFTASDVAADTLTLAAACGGSAAVISLDSFSCTFPGNLASMLVEVSATDEDSGVGSDSALVTIGNLAPTISALTGPASVVEGGSALFSFTYADAGGDAVSFAPGFPACPDGSPLASSLGGGSGSVTCAFANGPAGPTVGVRLIDSDGALSSFSTTTISVQNAAPVVTFDAIPSTTFEEGTSDLAFAFTVADVPADSFNISASSCGVGATTVSAAMLTATTGQLVCSFPDGPATPQLSITVSDGTDTANALLDVTVTNVLPTVSFVSPPTSGNEGDTLVFDWTSTDPGDDPATFISATCVGSSGAVVGLAVIGLGNTFSCPLADGPGTLTATITIQDGSGEVDESAIASVLNVAPTLVLTGEATPNEGAQTWYGFSISDPGQDSFGSLVASCDGGTLLFPGLGISSGSFACVFPDGPAAHTASAQLRDSDGASSNLATFLVNVQNVAPTLSLLSGPLSPNEGATSTYTFTVSDPGADTYTLTASCDGGVLPSNVVIGALGGSFDCIFPDGPAAHSVSAQVFDSDGAGSHVEGLTASVQNVAPTVSTPSGLLVVDESDTAQRLYTFTVSDPGVDTFAFTAFCTNGALVALSSTMTTPTAGQFACIFPDGPAAGEAGLTPSDEDGAYAPIDANVQVDNVSPVATLTGAATADEGDTKTYHASATDVAGDTITLAATCAGALAVIDLAGDFTCTFTDNALDVHVVLTASDEDGGSDEETILVDVANLAPLVGFVSGPSVVNEGTLHAFSFLATDVPADPLTYTASCAGGAPFAVPTADVSCSFPDNTAAPVAVALTATDDEGASTTQTHYVTVLNVAPSLAWVLQPASGNEGTSAALSFLASDVAADLPLATIVAECDGVPAVVVASAFSCALADGPGSVTAHVGVADKDGGVNDVYTVVSILNVAPDAAAGADFTVPWGSPAPFSGSASDVAGDMPLALAWDYTYDATFDAFFTTSSGPAPYSYSTPGTYTAALRADDGEGGVDIDTVTVTVAAHATALAFVATTDASKQYSDVATLTASLVDALTSTPLSGKTIAFSLAGVNVNGVTDASGVASVTIPIGVGYNLTSATATFAGDALYDGTNALTPFLVERENALVVYSGDLIAQIKTSLQLRATVWDSAAVGFAGVNPESGAGATIGDIRKMHVAFAIYSAGSCNSGSPVATLIAPVTDSGTLGDGIGTALATYSSNSEVSLCVVPRIVTHAGGVNAYYVAPAAQPAGLAFYQNSGQFVAGGGWVWDPAGTHGNMGYNARYNKNGQAQGQMVYVWRGVWNGENVDFVVKSNALTALQFSGNSYPISAKLQGKATIQINRQSDSALLWSSGGATFFANATDSNANSGIGSDSWGIRVWDKDGVLFHDVAPTLLSGGNVKVQNR